MKKSFLPLLYLKSEWSCIKQLDATFVLIHLTIVETIGYLGVAWSMNGTSPYILLLTFSARSCCHQNSFYRFPCSLPSHLRTWHPPRHFWYGEFDGCSFLFLPFFHSLIKTTFHMGGMEKWSRPERQPTSAGVINCHTNVFYRKKKTGKQNDGVVRQRDIHTTALLIIFSYSNLPFWIFFCS